MVSFTLIFFITQLIIILYIGYTKGVLAAFGISFIFIIISIVYGIYSFVSVVNNANKKNKEEIKKEIKKEIKEEEESKGIKETFFSLFKKI
jgi:Na+-transporting methylmalonyl-CoA/oxaloacetate decarboxylase gamma subunit